MRSPKYQGRHHNERHRHGGAPVRPPRVTSSRFVLPVAAAAVLVMTATGATVAESAPLTLALTGRQTAIIRAEQASDIATATDIAHRRQASGRQTAALQGRVEAQQTAARTAKRKAAEAAAARAKATAARAKATAARAKATAARAKATAARAKAERAGKRWVKAIRTGSLTSGFGPRWGKTHDGLDFAAPTGTPVYAMSKGTVILSDNVSSFGNKIEIRYWNGTVSWYGHLSRRDVQSGDTVMPGDKVGLVGNTGHSFGPHLHLEIHPNGGDNPIDPHPWLAQKGLLR